MPVDPTGADLRAFLQGPFPDDAPVVMLNLLRFREQALYPEDAGFTPCTGREAYARYGQVAMVKVAEAGGVVTPFRAYPSLVGDTDWHQALLVRYPSRQAFLAMIADPTYQVCTVHRTAALEDARLIPLREG